MDIVQRLRSIEGSAGDRYTWPRNPDGEHAIAEILRLRAELAAARDAALEEAALIVDQYSEVTNLKTQRRSLSYRSDGDRCATAYADAIRSRKSAP